MRTARFVFLVGSLSSLVAVAQASGVEDKKAETFNEIERGFFFQARGGFWGVVNPPSHGTTYFSSGMGMQVDIGYDIGERISASAFLLVASNGMKSDYTGLSENGATSGDFSTLAPGVEVLARLVGFDDSQEVKRVWVYLRAGAGVVFYSPSALIPTMDVLLSAGPGIEYFTRLRHFSIGLEANFNFMALTQSVGFSVMPTVKYAF